MHSDDMKDNYDFSKARRGGVVNTNKERITIRLDPDVIQWFRDQVKGGGNYQTLINDALRAFIDDSQRDESLEDLLRRVLKEELAA